MNSSRTQATSAAPARTVRSFVVRAGRLTPAQRRAIADLWDRYGLRPDAPLDLMQAFGRRAPCYLELGFGNGDALLDLAQRYPGRDYLGVEVHPPGIGRVLAGIASRQLGNVRVLWADAVEVLQHAIPRASLAGIQIWFPDPWPKLRHHKRRLIQTDFVTLLVQALKPGGRLHLATDWEPYAVHMLAVVDRVPGLQNLAGTGNYFEGPTERPVTRFQRRGEGLGHGIWDLLYERVGSDGALPQA